MLQRIVTSVIGFPLIVWLLISGGAALLAALLCVAVIGMCEFHKATGRASMLKTVVCAVAAAGYFGLFLWHSTTTDVLAVIALTVIVSSISLVVCRKTVDYIDSALMIMSFFYVAFLLGFVFMLREGQSGVFLVWLAFIAAWGADTCAYFTGMLFGKRKLCPELSPKKTIEGAIGGVLGAVVLAILFQILVYHYFNYTFDLANSTLAVIVAIAAVLSIFGDLTASAIKRQTGVKDFGKLFPGHGGILDRFDSLLFTAPAIYIMLNYFA